jgi:protein involved in polysaccharide export with SLBB domain
MAVIPSRFSLSQIARSVLLVLAAATATATDSARAGGQSPTAASGSVGRKYVSRETLEAAAKAADGAAAAAPNGAVRNAKRAEAARIRQRLAEGDFQPGHRVLLTVAGDSALTDTFTVRADRVLILKNLPPISLQGVLESELQGYLTKEISKYLRNPDVQTQTLLNVAVEGAVTKPGFLSLPTDMPFSGAIMAAGGPASIAEIQKIFVRRGKDVAVPAGGVQDAIKLGLTLSDVGVRPGDAIVVPDKQSSGTSKLWQNLSIIAGLVGTIVLVSSRR